MLRMRTLLGLILTGGLISAVACGDSSSGDGCEKDTDCKGDRVCDDGECVDADASGTGSGTCTDVGKVCSAGDTCCNDALCVGAEGEDSRCADQCTLDSQCQSGCCAPLSNSSARVCSDPSFCGTTPMGGGGPGGPPGGGSPGG